MLKFSMCLSGVLFEKKLTKKRFLDFYNLQKIEAGKYPPVSYHRLRVSTCNMFVVLLMSHCYCNPMTISILIYRKRMMIGC